MELLRLIKAISQSQWCSDDILNYNTLTCIILLDYSLFFHHFISRDMEEEEEMTHSKKKKKKINII